MDDATTAEETKAEQIFNCAACCDTGKVRFPFQTLGGVDRFKEMQCPECFGQPGKPGTGKFEFDSVNRRLRAVENKQEGISKLIAAAVVIAGILLLLSMLRDDKKPDAFAQAVKETT